MNYPKYKNYIDLLINEFPEISSGRKNYQQFEIRVKKNIDLTKKMMNSVDIDDFISKLKKINNYEDIFTKKSYFKNSKK